MSSSIGCSRSGTSRRVELLAFHAFVLSSQQEPALRRIFAKGLLQRRSIQRNHLHCGVTAAFRVQGQVNCGHCHDVHGKDSANNPKSLRFAPDSDRMCIQCHTGQSLRTSTHTRHAAGLEASRCVSCHMPAIMNSMLFRARTHQIDDVPSPARLERFGPEESPNACMLCHQEKTVEWLRAALKR